MLCIFECQTVTTLKMQPPCVIGWKWSINALLGFWEDVKLLPNVQYLCTRKINQDPLENCFSVIRSQGGFCDNPDSKKFADAYKHVMIKSCMLQSELVNCEPDVNSVLLDVFYSSKTALGVKSNDINCPDTDVSLSEL